MAHAINAMRDVLNAQELDAVSGGFTMLPLVAMKVLDCTIRIPTSGTGGGEPGPSSGGQDPAQMFQQILNQLGPK